MILSDGEFEVAQTKLAELNDLKASVDDGGAGDPGFEDLQADALDAMIDELRDELAGYEQLRDGTTTTLEVSSLAGLAEALIKARIARGWTQADLARKLEVSEQQVQRDEANRYAGAALARLGAIADALDLDVTETITLRAG